MKNNTDNNITLTTPPLKLVFKAHLVEGDRDFAEKHPRAITLKDGNVVNTNLRYRITGDLPLNTMEAKAFSDQIQALWQEAVKSGGTPVPIPMKPGSKKVEEGQYEPDESVARFAFSKPVYQGSIPVYENGKQVGSQKLVLTRGTLFTVELEVRPYNFRTEDSGENMSGITLYPVSITILERTPTKSIPYKYLKK